MLKIFKLSPRIRFTNELKLTRMVDLPIEYSDKQVTSYGGVSLMKRFIDQAGIRNFMQGVFDQALKGNGVGLVRADSGFYTEGLLNYLKEKQHDHIMAVRMCPNVKSTVRGLGNCEIVKTMK